jgi:hypothetical protein
MNAYLTRHRRQKAVRQLSHDSGMGALVAILIAILLLGVVVAL